MFRQLSWCSAVLILFFFPTPLLPAPLLADQISFDRDVLPILSDKCFKCHGPDQNARQANLRLDLKETALRTEDPIVIPKNIDNSRLVDRITASDPTQMMPPPASNLKLTPTQIKILKQWISEGATWGKHWAFVKPVKPTLPSSLNQFEAKNEIDRFIQVRLARQQLRPSPKADKETLLRRVTMDLTGLSPTIEEIESFLADNSGNAYDRLLDRLLATDAHAERLTLDWMDLSRYADSHGLHADGWRRMWPWRDWVISAFQKNMPYDEFVTWQLAGDLMPNPSTEQILATAFHRNHPMTAEGGVIDEEFRLYYVFDRVETTATAFLGLTMNCARCHDHKFDPISQKEYYQLAAFFNNVRELGMTGDDGNYGPVLALPDAETAKKLEDLDQQILAVHTELKKIQQQEKTKFKAKTNLPVVSDNRLGNLVALQFPLDAIVPIETEEGETVQSLDGNKQATVTVTPKPINGVDGGAMWIDGEYQYLTLKGVGAGDVTDPFSVSLWIHPQSREPDQLVMIDQRMTRTLLGTTGGKNQYWRGWDLYLDYKGHLAARLIHNLPDILIHVRSVSPIVDGKWTHVAMSYDGTGQAAGISLFINGKSVEFRVVLDQLTRTILPDGGKARDVRAGRSYRGFTGDFGIYQGGLDDIRFYELALTQVEVEQLFRSYHCPDLEISSSVNQPTSADRFQHWLSREHTSWQAITATYRELQKQRIELFSQVPLVMVMAEMEQPRNTYRLHRGEYSQLREQVEMGTPKVVAAFPKDLPSNRLGLSQWLFDPDNPLTSRVAVNHYWQMLFGHGLVRTPHDFGVQGQRPTHPELLDWLSVWFRESGWNVRDLLKLIIASATYRQSSVVDPISAQQDPDNRLLWRFPSYRWMAEFLRDNALAGSGLLTAKVGGSSVKPYQPPGLWIEKNNFSGKLKTYQADTGESLYRRSLYTFIRRTSPPPAMTILDAPNRSVCTVKREVTNTPLQALVMMNDPQFVEAARILAERIQRQGDKDLLSRLVLAFRLLTGRQPKGDEIELLVNCYHHNHNRFEQNSEATKALLSVGERPFDETLPQTETAAFAVVANLIMNYDGFYMKR